MKLTPMMQQYLDAKERYPDAVLFFRMGDFYEMFFEDAQVAARELGITLTARHKGEDHEVPMAGVPHHAAKGYISQLIDQGFSVAICEQIEDASKATGIVKRDVVRVVTPGVVLDTDTLDANAPNFVAAVRLDDSTAEPAFGIAYLDVSTGEFHATEVATIDDVVAELHRFEPREVLVDAATEAHLEHAERALRGAFVRSRDDDIFDASALEKTLRAGVRLAADIDHDGYFLTDRDLARFVDTLDDFGFRASHAVIGAASAALAYIVETQRGIPAHVRSIQPYRADAFLVVDDATKANLELTETLMGGKRSGSLLSVIDKTVTALGGRLLRHWLNYPLVDPANIEARLSAVDEAFRRTAMRDDLRAALDGVYDLERLCGRISSGTANARDLRSLISTLAALPELERVLSDTTAPLWQELASDLDPYDALRARIDGAIVDNPPTSLTEGGLFKRGFHDELDEILELAENGKDWMLRYEAEQKQRTDISSLKVRFNKVFGYFIEVTKANLDLVPDDYIRKQTLTNSERYFTPELKEMEERILGAQERRHTLEYQLFEELRREVGESIPMLLETARRLATIDVLTGFAELAVRNDYVRPAIEESGRIHVVEGRHPVVERTLLDERFVPNDVDLDTDASFLQIITGPNMAGKSTVIRQVALITLLAQMGSFVPAKEASIGVVDKIFSRVGASDNLARGQSTFMVEMTEAAHILRNATPRSLIILDEIGRGTSTFDGLSIAWAVAEHLHDVVGAKTMFATHYHELTELTRTLDGAVNMSIAVKEWNDDIIFLRKLVEGEANRSYGIQVGRLAGLPEPVVKRAKEVLANLEAGQFDDMGIPVPGRKAGEAPQPTPHHNPDQMTLFGFASGPTPAERDVLDALRASDFNQLTPIAALNLLAELAAALSD
jgi:DNA mismatch repair protein MutS